MRARSEMIASVMPSAKYSCAGSCETLRSGSTAIARIASRAGRRAASRPRARRGFARSASRPPRPRPGAAPVPCRRHWRDQAVELGGASGRSERTVGAALLMIANISASARSLMNGRWPVAISNSMTPSA